MEASLRDSERVLILAPVGRTAPIMARTLSEMGYQCVVCEDVEHCCRLVAEGAGTVLLIEEVFADHGTAERLAEVLDSQEEWSELPVHVFVGSCALVSSQVDRFQQLSSRRGLTVLERPVQPATLDSLVDAALRNRRRQYQLRDALAKIAATNQTLEARVADQTQDLRDRERRLAKLAEELAQAEQKERTRISRVLHDHVQQLLVAALMRVGMVHEEVDDDIRQELDELVSILEEANSELRSLSVQLSPPMLHEQGLTAGLEWLGRRMHRDHGLRIEVVAPPHVDLPHEATRNLLFQAVRELLLNVVKHAGTDQAWVRVEQKDNQIHLEVRDGGLGFDADFGDGGDGQSFGLFHLRERLRHAGGDLDIQTSRGEGTAVELHLPLPAEEELAPSPAAPDGGGENGNGASRVRVLVVDDHQTMREGLVQLLERERNLEVVGQCGDGLSAVESARAIEPDVVLMDVNLPGINGIEATRRIKSALPRVQVIGLSLHREEDMAGAMLEAGADRYLNKAGPPSELTAAIEAACK